MTSFEYVKEVIFTHQIRQNSGVIVKAHNISDFPQKQGVIASSVQENFSQNSKEHLHQSTARNISEKIICAESDKRAITKQSSLIRLRIKMIYSN